MKLYIISNRLPVKVTGQEGAFAFTRSEGGLATGLDSLQSTYEKHWIGWPGICPDSDGGRREIRRKLEQLNFHPVYLSEKQIENYYEGYSNSTLWPLCHYFYVYTHCRNCYWEAYREVNEIFCRAICELVEPGDKVWVQDYQLMLLPAMLRKAMPDLCIGYFHHIPFPSYELFRILPERAQILEGVLGADFIAFHTPEYMRHFVSAAEHILHVDFDLDEAQLGNRIARVDALPMGINYDMYHRAVSRPEIRSAIEKYRQMFGNRKLVLSVDRLDYSKGILHRLRGFATFLEHHPEYHGKVSLSMVIVPSRDRVGSYAELKTKIDEEIGAINGRYSTMNWTPVCYFYHAFPFEELIAMYYVADIALVTPLRDGMNLVAKEYVAVKDGNPGVLILSEMAGASGELSDALLINPNDTGHIEQALAEALAMPEAEQLRRMRNMQHIVSTQTVDRWAAGFMDRWSSACAKNREIGGKRFTAATRAALRRSYASATRRLVLLDYDGTLAPICRRPEEAVPSPELLATLDRLAADPRNKVVVNSGRDRETLEQWLGLLDITVAAEHGASYKEGGVWYDRAEPQEWKNLLYPLLNLYLRKTPGARLEVKRNSLAWHYRECDPWLGRVRSVQLANALMSICLKHKLHIVRGNKVVEIKSSDYSKGSEVERLLAADNYDFIVAIGDDTTDDDMFEALPADAYTIKVGNISPKARYDLPLQGDVLPLLQSLGTGDEGWDEECDGAGHNRRYAACARPVARLIRRIRSLFESHS